MNISRLLDYWVIASFVIVPLLALISLAHQLLIIVLMVWVVIGVALKALEPRWISHILSSEEVNDA